MGWSLASRVLRARPVSEEEDSFLLDDSIAVGRATVSDRVREVQRSLRRVSSVFVDEARTGGSTRVSRTLGSSRARAPSEVVPPPR